MSKPDHNMNQTRIYSLTLILPTHDKKLQRYRTNIKGNIPNR